MGKQHLEKYEKNKQQRDGPGYQQGRGQDDNSLFSKSKEDLIKAAVAIIFVLLMVFSAFVTML